MKTVIRGVVASVAGLGAATAVQLGLGLVGVNPVPAAFPATAAYCWGLFHFSK